MSNRKEEKSNLDLLLESGWEDTGNRKYGTGAYAVLKNGESILYYDMENDRARDDLGDGLE